MGYSSAGKFVDEGIDAIKQAAKGTLHSNKAINPINNFTGAVEAAGRVIKGEGFGDAVKNTFGRKDAAGALLKGKDAGWNAGKIAGSYLGAMGAGRVISGGGVYKDGSGNTNLVGVPFV